MVLSRKIAQGLILALALGLTAMLVLGIWRGKTQQKEQVAQQGESTDAAMKLSDMEYTEMQEGRQLWTLKATEARYFQEEQKTELSAVRLTLFLEDGDQVLLESKKGILFAGTKNIELSDTVRATLPRGYTLSTEKAFYDHQVKAIHSDTLLHLKGPDIDLQGNQWRFQIPERQGMVEGQVRATVVLLPPNTQLSQ